MQQKKASHRLIITITAIAAVVMFAFCFVIAPFYSVICQAIGISTASPDTLLQKSLSASVIDNSREIEIQFVAVNHKNLPWDFYPRVQSMKVHPGQHVKITYFARNNTNSPMTVQAIPSMTPPQSASHFHKIECFCFEQQELKAREGKDMALVFQIDTDLPKDIQTITLAYTLFDVTQPVRKK